MSESLCPFIGSCRNWVLKEDFKRFCLNRNSANRIFFENCINRKKGTLHTYNDQAKEVKRLKKIHDHKHTHWREDLQQCHNPQAACWCCVCSGFMCICDCHRQPKQETTIKND